jgi:hypothetical protein
MIYSPERKENNNQSQDACNHVYKNSTRSKGCSLCLRRSSSITPDLIVPPCSSPFCPHLCWASTAYLFPFLAATAPLSPPPPMLTLFPSDPRQQSVSMLGTVTTVLYSWRAITGPVCRALFLHPCECQ